MPIVAFADATMARAARAQCTVSAHRDPLRVMIVDDEAHAREGMRIRLKREPDVLVIGEYGDAESALRAHRARMRRTCFFSTSRCRARMASRCSRARARARCRSVIFVTAHDTHAVRAFDARALDYLLKPVEQERLRAALDRARREARERAQRGVRAARAGAEPRARVRASEWRRGGGREAGKGLDRIPVSVDGTIHFVATKDIDYIAAAGDAVSRARGRGGARHPQVDERDARDARPGAIRAHPPIDDRESRARGEGSSRICTGSTCSCCTAARSSR